MKFNLYIPMLFFIIASCSGIKVLNREVDFTHLYSDKFLSEIAQIKKVYQQGDKKRALSRLEKLLDEQLMPVEKAFKYNLMGVMKFSDQKYKKSIFYFDIALTSAEKDKNLIAQIKLNLATAYYKLGLLEKAYGQTGQVESLFLKQPEQKKLYQLRYYLSERLKIEVDQIKNLTLYLGQSNDLDDLRQSPHLEKLISHFSSLSTSEKVRFMDEYKLEAPLSIGYLAYIDAEKMFYGGQKESAQDLIGWIKKHFANVPAILDLAENFSFRIQNFSKMDPFSVGVILPLSGREGRFGNRALYGLDYAFHQLPKKSPLNLVFKDSEGSGVLGAYAVQELVEKSKVSIIIGGLTPNEATREYLEARKYGVLFISLYPIYLPREEKNHLLIEIPGSIESQVREAFSPSMIDFLGDRVAIMYPKDLRGETFIEEAWSQALKRNIKVARVQAFEKDETDYTQNIKQMLSLEYPREREEELELKEKIEKLKFGRRAKRIQTLAPHIDFDWVYLPVSPGEAIQIIPSFYYFDANNVKFLGDASWLSRKISQQSQKLGPIYFLGSNVNSVDDVFKKDFYEKYKTYPKLIEINSYEAAKLAFELLKNQSSENRDEFEMHVRGKKALSGMTGTWSLSEELWLKNLTPMVIRKGEVQTIFSDEATKATVQ